MFALNLLGDKEIKNAIWDRVLLCSCFYLVNLDSSKFLRMVTGIRGVNCFIGDPDKPQIVDNFYFGSFHFS